MKSIEFDTSHAFKTFSFPLLLEQFSIFFPLLQCKGKLEMKIRLGPDVLFSDN